MTHRFHVLALAFLVFACASCKDKPSAVPGGAPSATATSATAPTAPADPATVRGRQLAYCPSAVFGATTEIRDGKGSFDVVVTAHTDSAVQEIREKSKHLALIASQDPVNHSGVGMVNASLEECPSLIKDTTVTETDVEGGAIMTLLPTQPEALIALRRHSFYLAKKFSGPSN